MAFNFYMIKKYRVRKNQEFAKIIAKKKSVVSESFVVYFEKRKENYSRVGISVSKKLGDAVTRNKIKRQVRMMLADFYDFEANSVDLIIIVRNRYFNKTFNDNLLELENLVKKAII